VRPTWPASTRRSPPSARDLRHRHRHLRRAPHPRVAGAHGDRFARKILSDGEFATWRARSARWPERGVSYLATRFSAKEAFSKAIGMGMRMPMTWRSVRDRQAASGKPVIVLHGVLKAWFEARGLTATSASPTKPTTRPASWSWNRKEEHRSPP
jgi:holo-[acyl-carrier protein] synthase